MTLMAASKPATIKDLPECALKALAGRVDGRDCGHISGLVRRLGADHLKEVKAAHAELVIGCQCCFCWEHDRRAIEALLRDR
ncbi:hypothetical protein ACFXJ8_26155 [Nonomuraea sp. NPDC059194]|uniref:hypothetical protein n=1 Tax=Nonomuraea sp. NPDC059194 TaxID=3346764 RepID=UPI0036800609